MIIIGIDPGNNGGIAVTNTEGSFVTAHKIPTIKHKTKRKIDEDALVSLFKSMDSDEEHVVYLEQVSSMSGQGVVSMFTFGDGYGLLRGIIKTLGWEIIKVRPQVWQSELGLTKKDKSETNTVHKSRILDYVAEIYSDIKITKAISDAIAIMHYGKLDLLKTT